MIREGNGKEFRLVLVFFLKLPYCPHILGKKKKRLKSTFDPLNLGVFSFWLTNFEIFHSNSLSLSYFQNGISVQIC